ncbi:MAG TPA: hypothetical protein VGM75_13605 [Pseudonocardiaceae bacterium]
MPRIEAATSRLSPVFDVLSVPRDSPADVLGFTSSGVPSEVRA